MHAQYNSQFSGQQVAMQQQLSNQYALPDVGGFIGESSAPVSSPQLICSAGLTQPFRVVVRVFDTFIASSERLDWHIVYDIILPLGQLHQGGK